MTEVMCRRVPGGLAPESDAEAEKLRRIKNGASVRVKVAQEINPRFRRKWWALAQYAFEVWSDTMPDAEYKGQEVQPNFERFRKDLTILAGHFHPVWAVNGDLRVEADSLAFGSMDEQTFERLYSATINAILTKILASSRLTEADLRAHVDRVMRFE